MDCFCHGRDCYPARIQWAGTALEDQDFGLAFLDIAVRKPSVWVAILGYAIMFALWINILKWLPLSRAYLITAIVYVPVTIGAWFLFGEQISMLRGAGIAAIMIGVVLIAS